MKHYKDADFLRSKCYFNFPFMIGTVTSGFCGTVKDLLLLHDVVNLQPTTRKVPQLIKLVIIFVGKRTMCTCHSSKYNGFI